MMRYDRFNSNKYKLKWRKIQSGLLSWPMYIYIIWIIGGIIWPIYIHVYIYMRLDIGTTNHTTNMMGF